MSHTGLSILDLTNEKGETPRDACKGKGSGHHAASQVFLYAQGQKDRGYKTLQPPRALWCWYLLMPVTIFLAGALIGELLQGLLGW